MSSIKEIAADVGVSHALVSRVLNNRMGTTRVSEKTKQAILDRAKALNYTPNQVAVALKSGRKGAIGLFLHGVGIEGTELSKIFIETASRVMAEKGFNLWLQFFRNKGEFLKSCNENLLQKVDGLIVAGIAHEELIENLKHINQLGLPVVTACHGKLPQEEIPNFSVNSEAQGYLTTKHLLDAGCQRIAHFKTRDTFERFEGFLRAHQERDLQPDEQLIIDTNGYSSHDGFTATKELISRMAVFDGISTHSDSQAAGALRYFALNAIDRSLWPKITGIDNSPIARFYSLIPLTSATAEMETCAELSVQAIIRMLHKEMVKGQTVQPKLVIRESTLQEKHQPT